GLRVAVGTTFVRGHGGGEVGDLENPGDDQGRGIVRVVQAVVGVRVFSLELKSAVLPGEAVGELAAQLRLEAVSQVATAEDPHLDEQLALLRARTSDRLEGLIALLLRDESLLGEDLTETFLEDVRAHEGRPPLNEENDLLRASVEQIQATRRFGASE